MSAPGKLNAPWAAMEGAGLDRGSIYYVHGKQERIAVVYYPAGAHSYGEARAKLIAAAPDLLEQLQEAVAWAESDPTDNQTYRDAIAKMKAAIAKATGR